MGGHGVMERADRTSCTRTLWLLAAVPRSRQPPLRPVTFRFYKEGVDVAPWSLAALPCMYRPPGACTAKKKEGLPVGGDG